MSCPIKVNSNTIELTVLTSCYCILDLLCVKYFVYKMGFELIIFRLAEIWLFFISRFADELV